MTADQVMTFRRRVNPMTLLEQIGGNGRAIGMLDSPHGICFGRKGEIVVADTGNHRIQVCFYIRSCL